MEYFSLASLLGYIADAIELQPRFAGAIDCFGYNISEVQAFLETNNPRIEWARKISIAAKWLNEAIHNSTHHKPKWMVSDDEKQFPICDNSIEAVAVEILTHATGWGCRLEDNCDTTLRNAISLNKFDTLPINRVQDRVNEGLWPEGIGMLPCRIFFIKEEILSYLTLNDIPYMLPINPITNKIKYETESTPEEPAILKIQDTKQEIHQKRIGALESEQPQPTEKALPAHKWTDMTKGAKIDLILKTINALKFDKDALPVGSGKTLGAKSMVREQLNHLSYTKIAFDSFWRNMKADKHISDAK